MQKQMAVFKPNKLARSPTLDTVLMIEKALYKYKSDKTVAQIWRLLPKKVMWNTYITAIDYFEYSGKVYVEKDKTVTWLWNPERIKESRGKGLES